LSKTGSSSDQVLKENIRSALRSLGLTSSASSAFLTLISRPSASATTICNDAGIPDSKVYYALEELQSKGMITVQHGTPNLYKAFSPKEAMSRLKDQLTQDHVEKLHKADELLQMLETVHLRAKGSSEVELAYIIKGTGNILEKMKSLIQDAKREIIALIFSPKILQEIREPLLKAEERGVKVGLAIPSSQIRKTPIKELRQVRHLRCECCALVVDQRTLLTVSNWNSGDIHAMMTQDRSLITLAIQNFTNPACCTRT